MTRTITRSKEQKLQAPMGQVLRYKTHETSNIAVAVRRTLFTNPRAQSAALHGKTRSEHVHARAMAEERVDRESGAEEIVARESFNEEGSVDDIFGNCPHLRIRQPTILCTMDTILYHYKNNNNKPTTITVKYQ
jgi:hypothetical protein